jgi:hypothetical protein
MIISMICNHEYDNENKLHIIVDNRNSYDTREHIERLNNQLVISISVTKTIDNSVMYIVE